MQPANFACRTNSTSFTPRETGKAPRSPTSGDSNDKGKDCRCTLALASPIRSDNDADEDEDEAEGAQQLQTVDFSLLLRRPGV